MMIRGINKMDVRDIDSPPNFYFNTKIVFSRVDYCLILTDFANTIHHIPIKFLITPLPSIIDDTISYLIFLNYVKDKYHAQMREAQQVVTEKTSALEAEAYKTKRLQVKSYYFFFLLHTYTQNIDFTFRIFQLFLILK